MKCEFLTREKLIGALTSNFGALRLNHEQEELANLDEQVNVQEASSRVRNGGRAETLCLGMYELQGD